MSAAIEPQRWPIAWSHGRACVLSTAALLWECRLLLPGGRWVAPFAQAPWGGEDSAGMRAQDGHMRWLGGEFACLPFGVGGVLRQPAEDWRGLIDGATNQPIHGPAADAEWRLTASTESSLELALDYPSGHDVARLVRRIAGVAGQPALAFELVIEARRPCAFPVGLHPILALPSRLGALRIEASFEHGLTYPGLVEPGAMLTAPGRRFDDLAAVPAPDGSVDFSRFPAAVPAEDSVQLLGLRGPVRALDEESGHAVTVDWDRDLLPSCQIWISDRARTDFPWRGRFRGLGIEPTISAFDFATGVSQRPNPISALGYPTALALEPDRPTVIRYGIAVAPL